MLANPPFGVEWKQQQKYVEHEAESLGYNGRFGAGHPARGGRIAVELYRELVALRPAWYGENDEQGTIKVVMTGSYAYAVVSDAVQQTHGS